MGDYPARAVERAMKTQQVILRAVSGEIQWMQAAEIIGISDRSMRRWRVALERQGDREGSAMASPALPPSYAPTLNSVCSVVNNSRLSLKNLRISSMSM